MCLWWRRYHKCPPEDSLCCNPSLNVNCTAMRPKSPVEIIHHNNLPLGSARILSCLAWEQFTRGVANLVLDTSIRLVILEVKLTFELLTVRERQHSFSTHERAFLWKCQSFWDRKCLALRGTRTPNLRIHAECCNILSYQGQTFK